MLWVLIRADTSETLLRGTMFSWRTKKNIKMLYPQTAMDLGNTAQDNYIWPFFNWKQALFQLKTENLIVKEEHYENMPIQIYWKFHHQKMKIFR